MCIYLPNLLIHQLYLNKFKFESAQWLHAFSVMFSLNMHSLMSLVNVNFQFEMYLIVNLGRKLNALCLSLIVL